MDFNMGYYENVSKLVKSKNLKLEYFLEEDHGYL